MLLMPGTKNNRCRGPNINHVLILIRDCILCCQIIKITKCTDRFDDAHIYSAIRKQQTKKKSCDIRQEEHKGARDVFQLQYKMY
jgi:hypothetical protein